MFVCSHPYNVAGSTYWNRWAKIMLKWFVPLVSVISFVPPVRVLISVFSLLLYRQKGKATVLHLYLLTSACRLVLARQAICEIFFMNYVPLSFMKSFHDHPFSNEHNYFCVQLMVRFIAFRRWSCAWIRLHHKRNIYLLTWRSSFLNSWLREA